MYEYSHLSHHSLSLSLIAEAPAPTTLSFTSLGVDGSLEVGWDVSQYIDNLLLFVFMITFNN